MSMPIHKFPLEFPGKTALPKGQLLDIQFQGDSLVAWVRLSKYQKAHEIKVAFTGEDVGPWWEYLRTAQHGSLVVHLFRKDHQ